MDNKYDILQLLRSVADGSTAPEDALLKLKEAPFEDLDYAKIDFHRSVRQGAAGAVTDGLQPTGEFDQYLALRSQRQFFLISIKNFDTKFVFQLPNMIAHRRLGQGQQLGSLGVRSFFYNA